MLTETDREKLANRLKDLDYEYDGWDVDPQILRGGGSFDKKHPNIVINFYPTNRRKFPSLGNALGFIEGSVDYVEYGYCQLEQCVIRCRCHEHHKEREYNGRNIVDFLARKILVDIMREWDSILKTMNNACLDKAEVPIYSDVSIYNPKSGNWIFIYEISFFIRTQFRWNYVPTDYEEDIIAENIGLFYKSINEDNFNYKYVESD